jgi:fructose-specific phosphotransferase system IIC component
MLKALCIVGMVVAGMLVILFGLDLALPVGKPFGGVSMVMSIGFLFCAAVLGYLSWSTFREQT